MSHITLREAYQKGIDAGEVSAWATQAAFSGKGKEDWEQRAIESEQHSRQYSPFEFLAQDLNEHPVPDRAWEEYEKGVGVGVRRYIRQHTGKVYAPQPQT